MKGLEHPLAKVAEALRQVILKAHSDVGEEIKWNAPTFFFTGEMAPSDPKLYKRYLVVFNFFRKDSVRLVFLGGAKVKDPTGLLEGSYAVACRVGDTESRLTVRVEKYVLPILSRRMARAEAMYSAALGSLY